jgi:fatty-acyl-CoA synthase
MSPAHALAHHADRRPDELAVACGDDRVSWSELLVRTQGTAGGLAHAGVGRGDVVAILLHNSSRFLELMYACAQLGAVFMPLNWRLAGPELQYIVRHAQARVLVSEQELAPLVAAAGALGCDVVGVEAVDGWTALDELGAAGRAVTAAATVAPDDLARLMYTSGTTARPKGVMLTHANLAAKNLAHLVEFGITAADRTVVCGPLYHVGALDMMATTVLQAGGACHVLRRFDAGLTLDVIEREQITLAWMAPVMIRAVLDEPTLGGRDLGSVRVINGGGEKMPLPLVHRLRQAFPDVWFADAYGMTETVSGDTFLDRRMTVEKLGSVGKPVCNAELRIVDPAGDDVPAGTPGEILLGGPKVCQGYLHDPEATAAALRDGWLRTGDVGRLDEDGYLYIVDRLKDIIISGGENIASSEVERVLDEHPAVEEVAVVGRPDARWGEVPVAFVVCGAAPPSPAELEGFCRGRLSGFKTPKAFRFVDALPRNPSGKVLKRSLRELDRS